MKLKYYLRGLGVGILVTTVILMITSAGKWRPLSDQEIMKRAEELGMVMAKEEEKTDALEPENMGGNGQSSEESGDQEKPRTPGKTGAGTDAQPPTKPETGADTQPSTEPETGTDTQPPTNPQEGTGAGAEEQMPPEEGTLIPVEVIAGDVSNSVCEKLFAAGLITDVEDFNRYLSDVGKDGLLAVGTHQIPMGAAYEEIAEILCQVPEP